METHWKRLTGKSSSSLLPALQAAAFGCLRGAPDPLRYHGVRWSHRIAFFQFSREKDLFRCKPHPVDPLQQKTGCGGAQLISRLVNRCQGRIGKLGEFETVKPRNRQVFRTSQAKFASRL